MPKINDLTGSQWLFRSKSVIHKSYGQGSFAHKIRRLNKACKPPELCRDIIETFSHKGDLVFDPFAGTGGIIIGSQMAGRKSIGCEINGKYIDAYKAACDEMNGLFNNIYDRESIRHCSFINMSHNDDKEIVGGCDFLNIEQEDIEDNSVDLLFTDPPYFDMDYRKKSKRHHKDKGSLERPMEAFGVKFKDIMAWKDFIRSFCERAFKIVKSEKYMISFMEDMFIDGEYIFLTHILTEEAKKSGWVPQGEYIWYNEGRRAAFFGYPSTMITSRTHTSILFFRRRI